MPYIKQQDRIKFEKYLSVSNEITNAGEFNYFVTRLIDAYLNNKGLNYQNANEVNGVLESIKNEFYRRVVAPYEDLKIIANGDVYTCFTNFFNTKGEGSDESK